MTESIIEQNKRNGFLDIIKTITTILIIFHHFQQVVDVRFSVINFWDGSFYFGRLVELFFIISGFLMTPYVSKIKEGLSFKCFFIRRYFRLIPIVAISTMLDLIIKCVLHYESFAEKPMEILLETASVALGIHGVINRSVSFANNPMWYISALLWCYVLFYSFFVIYKRISVNSRIVCLSLLFVIMLAGYFILFFNVNYPFFNEYVGRSLVSFFSGVFLGVVLSKVSLSKKVLVPILIIIAVIFFIPILYYCGLSYRNETVFYVIVFCYSPVVILSKTDYFVKMFDHHIWSLMAKISFHAFCFHIPVIDMLTILFKSDAIKEIIYSNGVLSMIIYLMIVYVFSIMTYLAIEKPLFRRIIT